MLTTDENFFIVERVGHPKYGTLNFNLKQKDYIVNKYFSDNIQSAETLAKEFNVSPRTICKLIREQGFELKSLKSYRQKYTHNEHYFESIDSEEKAYWLGFLYADGFVDAKTKRFGLAVAKVDEEILYKLKNSLESNAKIEYEDKMLNGKRYYQSKIRFKSEKMVNDLAELGCIPNKTFKLKFPIEKQVPYHLLKHFLRGFTDGDGSLMLREYEYGKTAIIHWVGTFNMIFGIKNYLSLKDNSMSNPKNNNTFNLSVAGNIKSIYIMDYLYKDSTIYLERKYQKYLEIKKYVNENPPRKWINIKYNL